MQAIAVNRAPFLPNPNVLTNGPVSAARDITEDAVKEEWGRPSFAPGRFRRVLARW